MKVGILRIGQVENQALSYVKENLPKIFPKTECEIIPKTIPIPEKSYNRVRRQYHSSIILAEVRKLSEKTTYNRVLGITEADLYVPQLNFVFGQAECPGKAALISLFRLKPEFYGQKPDMKLFLERTLKEAVHELGHTLGLSHCKNPHCVMFFSNSILDTDRKGATFCKECQKIIERKIRG